MEIKIIKLSDKFNGFLKKMEKSKELIFVSGELSRAINSFRALFFEANGTRLEKDFINKIVACRKEAVEISTHLEEIIQIKPEEKETARRLEKEIKEISAIFHGMLLEMGKKES